MSDQKKESFRELLQRYHVGEQPQTREEGQPLPHRGLAPTTRFEPGEVCLPRISQTTDDLSHLDDCLVSILVEDILEHSLPYIHAVPLFVAVKAYGITCKRVSLLCSIYLENAIYRGKDPSAQSLIPDSEKRYIVGKLKAVLDEIPTLTTLSEQKESTLRGEINRGYYKILSAFISKKDLREFMRLAGERQIVEAEGLPLNDNLIATQPVNYGHSNETKSAKPKPKNKKREVFTQEAAAKAIGCSQSCIKKWERGEGMPHGYPGRGDLVALQMFAAQYRSQKAANKIARNMRRASTGYNIDSYGEPYETDTE